MKKILSLVLVISMFAFFPCISNASGNPLDDNTLLTTSDGISFLASEVEIYFSDFEGKEFSNSVEYADYIYQVGYNRANTQNTRYLINEEELTAAEIMLLSTHLEYVGSMRECRTLAIAATAQHYPTTSGDGQIGNAFQHAYWVMLMYCKTDPDFALSFSYAHEEYDGNDPLHKNMDIYNNVVAHNYCYSMNVNASTSDNTLCNYAISLVNEGRLEYIVFGYEYLHSIIQYNTGEVEYVYRTADLYAYTNSTVPFNIPETQYFYRGTSVPELNSVDIDNSAV